MKRYLVFMSKPNQKEEMTDCLCILDRKAEKKTEVIEELQKMYPEIDPTIYSIISFPMEENREKVEEMNEEKYISIVHSLKEALDEGLLRYDPCNKNRMLVYRNASETCSEGWYSENILEVAHELYMDEIEYAEFLSCLDVRKKAIEVLEKIDAIIGCHNLELVDETDREEYTRSCAEDKHD